MTAPECFDVMLFVEKTTAAFKNPAVALDPNLENDWLGIQFYGDVEKLVVDVVLPDDLAAKAGIKKGDVILKADVTTFTRFTDFVNYIRSSRKLRPGFTNLENLIFLDRFFLEIFF